jgi:hypothetical protein
MLQDQLSPTTKRAFLFLFLSLNSLFLLTSSGRVRTIDEVSVDLQAESLALHGTSAVPQAESWGTFYGRNDRWGRPRAPYGIAQAALVVPWHYAGRMLRKVLPGIPERTQDLFLDAVVVTSSATFSALAAALAFLVFVRMGVREKAAFGAALIVALGTPIFAYSAWFFSEPLVAAVLLGVVLVLFSNGDGAEITLQQGLAAGLLLGFAIWVRPTHLIAAPVFLLALLARNREKTLKAAAVLAVVVGCFGAAYLVRNQIYFGNQLDLGYPEAAEGGKQLNTFNTPLATGLFGYLFSPGKSLFLFAPPVVAALAGIPCLLKSHFRIGIIAATAPVVYILFFARYTQWEGGYCVGPRYLLPAIALLCLGLGPVFAGSNETAKRLVWGLFCAGLFVQVVSLSTSFVEDQATGLYYDHNWNYRMSYAPLVSQTKLLLHYLRSSQPAKLGLGFDRWFVFLGKAGISHLLLGIGLLLELLALGVCSWKLWRELAAPEPAETASKI